MYIDQNIIILYFDFTNKIWSIPCWKFFLNLSVGFILLLDFRISSSSRLRLHAFDLYQPCSIFD
jgi:hypothetical protein